MTQREREDATRLAIVSLTSAVIALARDVNRVCFNGLSDETSEKCRYATRVVSRLVENQDEEQTAK
jgi:hypothetical protein